MAALLFIIVIASILLTIVVRRKVRIRHEALVKNVLVKAQHLFQGQPIPLDASQSIRLFAEKFNVSSVPDWGMGQSSPLTLRSMENLLRLQIEHAILDMKGRDANLGLLLEAEDWAGIAMAKRLGYNQEFENSTSSKLAQVVVGLALAGCERQPNDLYVWLKAHLDVSRKMQNALSTEVSQT